jgi:hypothetical protein
MRITTKRLSSLALALVLLLALLPGSVLAATTPGTIATVSAAATTGKTIVNWTISSGATAYIIQRRVKDTDNWITLNSNVTACTYTDTTGVNGTVYQYRVRGRDGTNYGPFKVSSVVRAITPVLPGAIASVTASAVAGKTTVSWSASSGATAYIIQRRVKDSDTWTTLKSNVTSRSYEDTTGVGGTVYQYRVRGREGTNYGPFKVSSVVRAINASADITLGSISSVSANATEGKITVTWTSAYGAASYIVQRKIKDSDTWVTLQTNVIDTMFIDTTGENGVDYQYRVRGYNGTSYGPYKLSNTIRAIGSSVLLYFPFYLYSYDGKVYLGKLVTNKYDNDSIWNEYGTYGSKYSDLSIWNEYGTYGSKYSNESAFNDYASKPPMIVDYYGTVVGYLTTNSYVQYGYTIVQIRQFLINNNQ